MRRRSPLAWISVIVVTATLATVVTAFAATTPVTSKGLTVYRTCVLTPNPNTSTAGTDASVDQDAATTNFGTAATTNVQSLSGSNHRAYLRFDLTKCNPTISTTVSVTNATLRTFVTGLALTCRTYDLFTVSSSWTESGITWNDQPFGTTTNNPPTSQRIGTFNAGALLCANTTSNTYLPGLDVTTDVKSFVAGTATNNGWMLRDDTENNFLTAQTATFAAKEGNNAAQSPQLIVTYQV